MTERERGSNRSPAPWSALLELVPGPPRKWALDARGRPAWIPAQSGALWAPVFEWELGFGRALRLEMPVLIEAPRNGAGRVRGPDLERTRVAPLAAGLRDVWRCSYDYIAQQVRVPGKPREAVDPETAKRWAREGRQQLHRDGLLPWGAFEGATLPKRWWREDAFLQALGRWMVLPVEDPAAAASWPVRGAAVVGDLVQLELRIAQAVIRTVARR
jgi:hypothetical protein